MTISLARNRNRAYSNSLPLRKALKGALAIGVLLAALAIAPQIPVVALAGLSGWSLLGSRHAIQALTLVVIVKFLNPAVWQGEGVDIWGWIAVAAAGARIFLEYGASKGGSHPALPWLLLFAIVVFFESAFFSQHPVVSLFKILTFAYGCAAILIGFTLTHRRGVDWTPWFLGIWIAVVALSTPTLVSPAIAYARDGMGFQGILNHPQALAVFLSPVAAWLLGRLFFMDSKAALWTILLLIASVTLIFLTRGRTGIVAVAASFAVVMTIGLLMGRWQWTSRILKVGVSPFGLAAACGALISVILFSAVIWDFLSAFAFKGLDLTSLGEAFESSRGALITESLDNFSRNISHGIGFGVAESETHPFIPVYEPITGLPLSASTEKANILVAILEETGIVGTAFFALFLLSLARPVVTSNDLSLIWMFFACLFTNISEMTFFSIGGLGLYLILLMAWAATPRGRSGATATAPIVRRT